MAPSDSGTFASVIVPDILIAPHVPGPPTSRFASHYLELTEDSAGAERRDKCGRYRDLKDKNNHMKREYRHCMDGMCRYCAGLLAKSTFARWENTLKVTERAAEIIPISITYIEVSLPLARTAQAAKKFLVESCDFVEKGWIFLAGYRGPNAVLRILAINETPKCEHTHQQWAEKFPPSATVEVMILPASQLRRTFADKLLSTSLCLADAFDRAEQSAIFRGLRRFRARGIRVLSPEAERELFAGENPTANNSLEVHATLEDKLPPSAAPKPHGHDICPQCGERFDEETQWFSPDAVEPRPGERRWYPRHAPSPPTS